MKSRTFSSTSNPANSATFFFLTEKKDYLFHKC